MKKPRRLRLEYFFPVLMRRLGGVALLAPLDRPDAPYAGRFRLDAPDDPRAIRPPNKAPSTRRPRQPIALLFRLLACQDGLDRFEILARKEARKEARRWRRAGGGINCGGGGAPDLYGGRAAAPKDSSISVRHAEGGGEAGGRDGLPLWAIRLGNAGRSAR